MPTDRPKATGASKGTAAAAKAPTKAAAKIRKASTSAPPPPTAPAVTLEPPPTTTETHLGRVFVEAFDRLADRLLERLRSLRQDVDADLSSVRAELAGLRQSVDAVADRAQMRHLRSTLEEVHGDVVGLRRAVLEWPELEQIAHDITAVRGDLGFLFEASGGGPGQAPSELLAELQQVVANLTTEVGRISGKGPRGADAAPVLAELTALRGEVTDLRRRLAASASPLEDAQLEWLVDAVAERVVDQLADRGEDGARRGRRR